MIKGIRHVGLVVEDIEKALLFYRDILGFKVYWDKIEEGDFIETISHTPSLKLRTVKMKSADGSVLELLSCNQRSSLPVKKLYQTGLSHMALTVEDLVSVFSVLKEKGIKFLSVPQVSPDGKAKVSFCRDFEGNFLELVQELD